MDPFFAFMRLRAERKEKMIVYQKLYFRLTKILFFSERVQLNFLELNYTYTITGINRRIFNTEKKLCFSNTSEKTTKSSSEKYNNRKSK